MAGKNYIEKSLIIKAQPYEVFDVLSRLEEWNTWTQTITAISILKGRTFRVGAKIKVRQPKLLPAVWTITEIEPDKNLVWKKKSLGLEVTANHALKNCPEGTLVNLSLQYQGFLASLVYRLATSLSDRYLTMEIEGLKKHCETRKEKRVL